MISNLEFDSNLFELKVGKLEIRNDNFLADKKELIKYDLVYVFSDKRIDFLDNNLVDIKLTFELNLNKYKTEIEINKQISEYNIEKHDFNSLKRLAFLSGTYSRFKLDDNLPSNSFYDLYSMWIKKSIHLEYSDKVFVYTSPIQEDKVIGFVSVKIEVDIGIIGLIAVDNDHQGLGVGKSLLNNLLIYLKKRNIQLLKVSTQVKNTDAISFYNNYCFEESSRKYIYHLWPKKSHLINQ
ncbi:GNAT family N-acetyltransferase [Crocinitomicaceae bacterium]|nr:GNAT family N-acetyltransferase [Crocinitomicaceae bacterium]